MTAMIPRAWLPQVALLALLALLAPLAQAGAADAPAGRRFALLVGPREYVSKNLPPVPYAGADANDLARLLAGAGYDVILLTEGEAKRKRNPRARPTLANIKAAMRDFTAGKGRRDVLVFGFFGHGATMKVGARDRSFLCPADAQLRDPRTLLPISDLYKDLEASRAGAALLILDPTQEKIGGRGAVPLDTEALPKLPRGLSVLFGASRGQAAIHSDKLGTGHGAFAFALMEGLAGKASVKEELTWNDLTEYALKETPRVARSAVPRARQTPLLVANLAGSSPVLLAARAAAGRKTITNSIGMKFNRIPAGTFSMGSPVGEAGRRADESLHKVRISSPFYMGVYEVTQGNYARVMKANPSYFSAKGDGAAAVRGVETREFPVEQVSYTEAVAFCKALSALPAEKAAGRVYRLPTEAEWEYACRAGSTTVFAHGNRLTSRDANFDGRRPYKAPAGAALQRTCPVGSYAPNAWGLYDMHGNVYEWVSDWYAPNYGPGPQVDPTGPARGTKRIIRGGSWYWEGASCRSANRLAADPAKRGSGHGFRVVLVSP